MTAAAGPVIACAACGNTGPGRRKAGLCQRCYARAWRAARPCASCGQHRPHLAAGLCARCYRLSRTRLVLCPGCGEERPVYRGDRCERCKKRAAARAGACRDCGKQVARLWSGRCRSCYAKSREVTGACRDCGDLTRLTSGVCKACRLFRWAHPAGICPLVRAGPADRQGRGVPVLPARGPGRPGPGEAGPGTPAPGRAPARCPDPRDHRGLPRLRGSDLAVRRAVRGLPGIPPVPPGRDLPVVRAAAADRRGRGMPVLPVRRPGHR
jgi:hypothetical protein